MSLRETFRKRRSPREAGTVRRWLSRSGDGDLLEVAMGPHHPSTHGVFRMDVALDGERVIRLKPVFGYLHRNHEKLAEGMSYLGSMPFTDRLDYICPLTNNWAYALAVEKLTGQAVPERAEYLRVILGELTRIQNHASSIGFLIQEMGASGTPLMYAFREREKILDLFEALTGARMMVNYMRFGGCRVDATPAWLDATRKVVAGLPGFTEEMERLLTSNEILMARTQGVGILRPELADQRRRDRADAAGLRRQLRHSQGGWLRYLQPLQIPRAAGRSLGRVRPLHDSAAGDAGVDQDSRTGAERYSGRSR
jgi:NADH:ubiquinone oxidoreductase subunit D